MNMNIIPFYNTEENYWVLFTGESGAAKIPLPVGQKEYVTVYIFPVIIFYETKHKE
jgi:hypothetical protein